MTLTPEQAVVLRNDITNSADPAVIAARGGGAVGRDDTTLAAIYNALASPAFFAWRTAVEKKEAVQAVSRTGTSFIWAGNGFITRSAGELEAWNQIFNSTLTCNPSLANVRQAFADIFSGAGNAALNRTHLDVVARRQVTRAERLFATGTGADSSGGAGTLVWEGTLSPSDIGRAFNP
jgi:hypothetical protein